MTTRHLGPPQRRTEHLRRPGLGFNYRIDEPRAALLLSRLRAARRRRSHRRRELTRRYRRLLAEVPGLIVPFERRERAELVLLRDADDDRAGRPPGARSASRCASPRHPDEHLLSRRSTSSPPTASVPRRLAADHRAAPRAARSRCRCYPHMTDADQDRVVDGAARRSWHDERLDACRSPTSRSPRRTSQAVLECLESGWLTMGPRTQALRAGDRGATWARRTRWRSPAAPRRCISRASPPGIGPGDEVIVPGDHVRRRRRRRRATAAPSRCCATVRGPHDLNLDPEDVARRITPRTRAVAGGALLRLCLRSARAASALRRARAGPDRGLRPGDRRARATTPGARWARSASSARFSFFSKKQLCVGEGGMIATSDEELAARVRLAALARDDRGTWDRHRGHDPAYDVVDIGFNFRLDEPRAALGLSRLARLRRGHRRAGAPSCAPTASGSRTCPGIELAFDEHAVERSSHFVFPVLLADRATRDRFRDAAQSARHPDDLVPRAAHLHRVPPLRAAGGLPRATETSDRHCALPLSATHGRGGSGVVVDGRAAALCDRRGLAH